VYILGAFAFVDLSTIIPDDRVYFWGRVYKKISHCFYANPVTLKASGVQPPPNFPVVSQLVDVACHNATKATVDTRSDFDQCCPLVSGGVTIWWQDWASFCRRPNMNILWKNDIIRRKGSTRTYQNSNRWQEGTDHRQHAPKIWWSLDNGFCDIVPYIRKTRWSQHVHVAYFLPNRNPNLSATGTCFASAGPHLWNRLPAHLRQCDSLGQFKRLRKTHLFGSYCNWAHSMGP